MCSFTQTHGCAMTKDGNSQSMLKGPNDKLLGELWHGPAILDFDLELFKKSN